MEAKEGIAGHQEGDILSCLALGWRRGIICITGSLCVASGAIEQAKVLGLATQLISGAEGAESGGNRGFS